MIYQSAIPATADRTRDELTDHRTRDVLTEHRTRDELTDHGWRIDDDSLLSGWTVAVDIRRRFRIETSGRT